MTYINRLLMKPNSRRIFRRLLKASCWFICAAAFYRFFFYISMPLKLIFGSLRSLDLFEHRIVTPFSNIRASLPKRKYFSNAPIIILLPDDPADFSLYIHKANEIWFRPKFSRKWEWLKGKSMLYHDHTWRFIVNVELALTFSTFAKADFDKKIEKYIKHEKWNDSCLVFSCCQRFRCSGALELEKNWKNAIGRAIGQHCGF